MIWDELERIELRLEEEGLGCKKKHSYFSVYLQRADWARQFFTIF